MADLLPCPFCGTPPLQPQRHGGSDERNGYNFTVTIGCPMCKATITRNSRQDARGWESDKGEAETAVVAAWNLRADTGGEG